MSTPTPREMCMQVLGYIPGDIPETWEEVNSRLGRMHPGTDFSARDENGNLIIPFVMDGTFNSSPIISKLGEEDKKE